MKQTHLYLILILTHNTLLAFSNPSAGLFSNTPTNQNNLFSNIPLSQAERRLFFANNNPNNQNNLPLNQNNNQVNQDSIIPSINS